MLPVLFRWCIAGVDYISDVQQAVPRVGVPTHNLQHEETVKKEIVLLFAKPRKRPKWWPKTNDGWVTVDPDCGWRIGEDLTLTFPVSELEFVKAQMIECVGKCYWRVRKTDRKAKPDQGGKACPIE